MKKLTNLNALMVAGALSISSAIPLSAATSATIFDNTSNDLGIRFNTGNYEVGDQIILAGTQRWLQTFAFEFWGTNTASPDNTTFSGNVEAKVRFYQNNGPVYHGYATPAAVPFYDSGWFGGFSPTARDTFNFLAGFDFPVEGVFIPANEFTWTVQFQGLNATDTLGVDIFSPPTIGNDYSDYWQNDPTSGWLLLTNIVSPGAMDFAAKVTANQSVPEPSAVALTLVGGLGMLGWSYRLRRKK